MGKVISDEEKIQKLVEYYKDNGLLIVGLNDSQGVNTTSTFFKKGLLEYLAAALTCEELIPEVINAFSLTMNKTEHIDYFLKHNLSLEEIKLSQVYSAVSALQKVMTDVGLPKFFGNIGNIYKLVYPLQKGDKDIKISTSLKRAKEPVMIYSSGVNDLMREVGNNPFAIKGDYKNRSKRPNYDYTLEKARDPQTLRTVLEGIKRNYDSILSINSETDIYALGAYIPKSLQCEEMNIFRDLVISYNQKLSSLCRYCGVTFVDTEEVGKNYNHSEANFHISSAGHNVLANYLLGYMYQKKIVTRRKNHYESNDIYEISNKGPEGMIESALFDYEQSCEKAMNFSGYSQQRELAIAEEHKREAEIFQKVLKNRTK